MSLFVSAQNVEQMNEIVPFTVIETAPVYPGCDGTENLKKCTSDSIADFAQKNYNQSIFKNMNLNSKRISVYVMFTIDKFGAIKNIKARAEHPDLEREAVRVINSLPQMTPGKHQGLVSETAYSMPIFFTLG